MKDYNRTFEPPIRSLAGDDIPTGEVPRKVTDPESDYAPFKTLYDSTTLGVIFSSINGEISMANKAAEGILGLPLDKMRGRKLESGWTTIDESGSELTTSAHPLRLARETGRPIEDLVLGILNLSRHEFRWVNLNAFYQTQPHDDSPFRVCTTLADITEYRQVAETLQQRNRQLELLNRSGHTFNSTLDLDTILSTILEEVRFLLDVTICSVWLIDTETNELVCHMATDPGKELVRGWRLPAGIGIAGWAAGRRESLIVPDAQADQRHYKEIDHLTGLTSRSMLALPLMAREELIGVLEVVDERADCFDATHLAVLELVASSAANAIENARLIQNQREQWELAEALGTAAAIVNSSLEIDTVLDQILAQVQRVVAGDTFNIMLVEGYMAHIVRSRGYDEAGIAHLMPAGEIPIASFPSLLTMLQSGESVLIRDTVTHPDWVSRESHDWRSYVGAPITVDDHVVGFLNVNGTRPGQFRTADAQRLSTFANYAASAIENARLFEQTHQEISERIRAENALRESEERFRQLSQASEEGIAIHDRGIIADANDALARMFGYKFAEMIATRLEHYFSPDSWKEVADFIASGFDRPREVIGVRKDNSTFYCELDGRPYQYRSRTLHVAILRDITERKRNEHELHRRAAQQEALNAVIASAVTAPDISELLDAILVLGLQATELELGAIWTADQHATWGIPESWSESFVGGLRSVCTDVYCSHFVEDWRVVESDDVLESIGDVLEQLDVRAFLTVPILVEQRRIGGLSLAARSPRQWSSEEIALAEAIGQQFGAAAERLRLLAEIQKQASQMQQIIDTVPDGVLLLDDNGRIVLANPAAEQSLQELAGAVVGEVLTHLGGHPLPDLLEQPRHGLWHEIDLDEPSAKIFEIIARPVHSIHKSQSWVLAIRDVTQERQIEVQSRRQERLAAVGQLAAGIAHDFRNIMAVITLYTQMMRLMPDLSTEMVRRLGTVEHQAKRAGDLIQQVLDFSRRSIFERSPVDLLPLLQENVELLERTVPESIEISLVSKSMTQDANTPEFVISADPTRIQQVIMNLALNARDAMPSGGKLQITLGRYRVEKAQKLPLPGMDEGPEAWITITVEDTGEGVAADNLPHIFEPFFTTKASGKGTGLGLAQVYGIVKQHEGHIDVESEIGVGTKFTIYLPALSISGPLYGAEAAAALMRGQGETVLVVEDNPTTRQAFAESLENLNYHVLEAENGRDALRLVERYGSQVALVISDLVMPGMGGKDLAQALHRINPSLPIVVLTGHPMGDSAAELEQVGVLEWLQKPVALDHLAKVVNKALINPRTES